MTNDQLYGLSDAARYVLDPRRDLGFQEAGLLSIYYDVQSKSVATYSALTGERFAPDGKYPIQIGFLLNEVAPTQQEHFGTLYRTHALAYQCSMIIFVNGTHSREYIDYPALYSMFSQFDNIQPGRIETDPLAVLIKYAKVKPDDLAAYPVDFMTALALDFTINA